VPKGEVRLHQTTHLDITATVVELAGATSTAPTDLDGLSFASALPSDGVRPSAWRGFSFTEFFSGNNTWWNVRVVNATYAFTFHWWCAHIMLPRLLA
jgi:arylsulfatase A-like enzyme